MFLFFDQEVSVTCTAYVNQARTRLLKLRSAEWTLIFLLALAIIMTTIKHSAQLCDWAVVISAASTTTRVFPSHPSASLANMDTGPGALKNGQLNHLRSDRIPDIFFLCVCTSFNALGIGKRDLFELIVLFLVRIPSCPIFFLGGVEILDNYSKVICDFLRVGCHFKLDGK